MAFFEYNGRDNTGALVSGTLDASTTEEVATFLFGENVTPINIKEVKKPKRTAKKSKKNKMELERYHLLKHKDYYSSDEDKCEQKDTLSGYSLRPNFSIIEIF